MEFKLNDWRVAYRHSLMSKGAESGGSASMPECRSEDEGEASTGTGLTSSRPGGKTKWEVRTGDGSRVKRSMSSAGDAGPDD